MDGNILVLDGDRGKREDRQRNEMKSRTGDGRHDMNGNWEEEQKLEWEFKIPKGFRPTKSFTHIHQLKAQEGNNGSPVITIWHLSQLWRKLRGRFWRQVSNQWNQG